MTPVARQIQHAVQPALINAVVVAVANLSQVKRVGTYILKSEPGTSLKAAGWRLIGEVRGRSWSAPSRPRVDKHPTQDKLLFEIKS